MGRLEPPRRRHHGLPTDSLLHQPNEAIAPTPATRSRLSLRSIFSVTICVALALAAPVIAAARDAEERADARAILAKWNSQGPRRSDGCPMSCGMARDAFASGYCAYLLSGSDDLVSFRTSADSRPRFSSLVPLFSTLHGLGICPIQPSPCNQNRRKWSLQMSSGMDRRFLHANRRRAADSRLGLRPAMRNRRVLGYRNLQRWRVQVY